MTERQREGGEESWQVWMAVAKLSWGQTFHLDPLCFDLITFPRFNTPVRFPRWCTSHANHRTSLTTKWVDMLTNVKMLLLHNTEHLIKHYVLQLLQLWQTSTRIHEWHASLFIFYKLCFNWFVRLFGLHGDSDNCFVKLWSNLGHKYTDNWLSLWKDQTQQWTDLDDQQGRISWLFSVLINLPNQSPVQVKSSEVHLGCKYSPLRPVLR